MLTYTLLSLYHPTRWIIDWNDHVWIEVEIEDEWIHFDPCEGIVDDKDLYRKWGKVGKVVVAFWRKGVEDVTGEYFEGGEEMRKGEEVEEAVVLGGGILREEFGDGE